MAPTLGEATLRTLDGQEIKAAQLWSEAPVFVYAVRRPGCVLCRDEAQKLWQREKLMTAAGLRVVCVVLEWVQREVDAFVPEFWGGEVYHDVDKAFYRAFTEDGSVRTASALSLLNPFHPAWSRILQARRTVRDSNLNGEASILGGLMVVLRSGDVAWKRAELTFGDFPETGETIDAAVKAIARQ